MQLSKSVPSSDLGPIADLIISTCFDSVMVTEATAKTPILYVNEAFTKLTGYTSEEVLGKSPSLLQGADTDHAVLDQLGKDLAAGRNFEGTATNYRKDGMPFTMHWRVASVRSGKDQDLYFIAVQRQG
jgi:PAS domain S-box-containing protein